MVEFRILREGSKTEKQDHNPGPKRPDFFLFGDLLGRVPWDTALERRRVHKSWLIFKDVLQV